MFGGLEAPCMFTGVRLCLRMDSLPWMPEGTRNQHPKAIVKNWSFSEERKHFFLVFSFILSKIQPYLLVPPTCRMGFTFLFAGLHVNYSQIHPELTNLPGCACSNPVNMAQLMIASFLCLSLWPPSFWGAPTTHRLGFLLFSFNFTLSC